MSVLEPTTANEWPCRQATLSPFLSVIQIICLAVTETFFSLFKDIKIIFKLLNCCRPATTKLILRKMTYSFFCFPSSYHEPAHALGSEKSSKQNKVSERKYMNGPELSRPQDYTKPVWNKYLVFLAVRHCFRPEPMRQNYLTSVCVYKAMYSRNTSTLYTFDE